MNKCILVKSDNKNLITQFLLDYQGLPFRMEKSVLNADFEVHIHDFSELVIIVGGSAIHTIDGKEYSVKPGDVYVINGDTPHGFKNMTSLELYNIMFLPEISNAWGSEIKKIPGFQALFVLEPYYRRQHQFKSHLRIAPANHKYVSDTLNVMLEEFSVKGEGYEMVIDAYFKALVIFLCREYSRSRHDLSTELFSLAEAFSFIEKNYLQPVNIHQLASSIPMSVRHFIRIFKSNYGTTPMNYIIGLRLRYACELFRKGRLNVTAVSFECGFADSNYFSRLFKKVYGITPSKYMRKS